MDAPTLGAERLAALDQIQRRLLWLATLAIHHANNVRPNTDGTKIGGHQASSASLVSVITALYFHFLQHGDRVAMKPHAGPVFHAAQFLMGQLDGRLLTQLRVLGGLQSYPSRTKDPVQVDFSTGSVGLGAVAPAFAAVVHRYAQAHFGSVSSRRFVALLGDAELDEGNIWEAILDEALEGLGNLLWIVDLNRQSLDRVVPGVRAARLKRLFAEAGWHVLEAKYGRRLQALFARPGGKTLRRRIDAMSNEEYQALIRMPGDAARQQLVGDGPDARRIARAVARVGDDELPAVLANLGGHDLEEIIATLGRVDDEPARPTVIFAYTIKGWGLPIAGHPLNHAMSLSSEQIEALRQQLCVAADDPWAGFAPDSSAGELCAEAARRLFPGETARPELLPPGAIPDALPVPYEGSVSTQETFGRLLVRLADVPQLARRVVTTAPDVAVSTNLGGWINKTGVFAPEAAPQYETEAFRLLRWHRGPAGQHIELGIAEMNLFMLLAMLGLSAELCGQQLIPIGTVYDPFVCRGLDALVYGLYSGARFIFAGTPSGITLAPEGGAHQSNLTPSLAIELPKLRSFEPCFARELEWIFLDALRECADTAHGHSTFLRLTTRPVDQALLEPALRRLGEAELRRQALSGAYRLVDWRDDGVAQPGDPPVHIAVSGALVPEAVQAAKMLQREGVAASVLNIVSPRLLFEDWQRRRARQGAAGPLDGLLAPEERAAPIITVHDAATHALAWLGSGYGGPVAALGVDDFGQSGARADLYRHFGVAPEQIAEAAFSALDSRTAN
jgi:pyruvate dehydrogenase E1 component